MFSRVISLLFMVFFIMNQGHSKLYLNRNSSRLEYHKLTDTKLLTPNTYVNPFNGIACGEYNELDDYNYFITSSRQYTSRYNDKNPHYSSAACCTRIFMSSINYIYT